MRAMSQKTKDSTGIPWNNAEEMNKCLGDPESRARLIQHASTKGFTEQAGMNFLRMCFSEGAINYVISSR